MTDPAPQLLPYEARAWLDGQLVATTSSALRVDEPGTAPSLLFPAASVAAAGERLTRPAIDGYVTFDPDQVRVEVIDAAPGDDERDVTTKAFPTWGDAADLVEIMAVQPGPATDRGATYVSTGRADHRRPVVEGSQMLGQAIVAASRHAPGRRVVSASMVFVRVADASKPMRFELEELANGRTFTGLTVRVHQGERLCASGTFLLDVKAPDAIRHSVAAPDVAGPYESIPFDMSVTGRDIRVVDGAYTGDPGAPVGPSVLDAWVRFRDLPDDPPLHAGLLAEFTGHMPIAAAFRPHAGIGQDAAHRTLSTAINAITISFHADPRADEWMHYRHDSTSASDGMTHAECRVFDEGGALLASFAVEAMVRPLPTDHVVDERKSL